VIAAKLRGRVAGLVAAIAISLASPIASAIPTDPEAKAHLEKGNVLFQQGDFDGAAKEYEKGYEAQADPAFLYTWAQAERRRGRCAAAVKLYQRYIATNPPEVSAEYAREGILKCADELAADEPMPPGDERPSDTEDPTEPPSGDTTPRDEPPEPKPPDRNRWYRDPAAATLVALGAVGVGVGTGLLVAGAVEKDKSSANYGEFDERQKRAQRFQIAGGVVLGVGVGVLVGGIARWAVLRKREKKNGNVSAMIGRGVAGVVFTRRF
jgi:tetratricopeptide (TPR) repeat protein